MNASANPVEEVCENEEAAVVPEDTCSQVPKPKRWVPKSKSPCALLGRSFSKSSVFSSFTARRSSSVISDYSSSIYDEEDEAIDLIKQLIASGSWRKPFKERHTMSRYEWSNQIETYDDVLARL